MTGPQLSSPDRKPLSEDPNTLQEFENLTSYLKASRGFDFNAYKRSSLMRRTLVRMQRIGVNGFGNYLDYLQVDPEEFTQLFNTILINVTGFFRDPPAWEYLASDVLPEMLGPAEATHQIRVWSAGCASGEEAYTIAMLLAERLGFDQFRDRVKIYATDVDEETLTEARLASYEERSTTDVPPELRRKYFEPQNGRLTFNKELRRSVIFGRHDLVQDAPISRINLLICRNCLMYFNTETQARILSRFQFALVPGGVLMLGRAESLLTRAAPSFAPLDASRRLFTKQEKKSAGELPSQVFRDEKAGPSAASYLREAAADLTPVAQLVVDRNGIVLQISQQLRSLFGLSTRHVGRQLQDLEISQRPFELRPSLEQAYSERRSVTQSDAGWTGPGGQQRYFDLQIVPVQDSTGSCIGALIAFLDVTPQRRLRDELHRTTRQLDAALRELQSTNEELETMNQELQSINQELQTINQESKEEPSEPRHRP